MTNLKWPLCGQCVTTVCADATDKRTDVFTLKFLALKKLVFPQYFPIFLDNFLRTLSLETLAWSNYTMHFGISHGMDLSQVSQRIQNHKHS